MSNSSNNVFDDISAFFNQFGALNTPDQVNSFFQQYWYVWLIISIGVVVLITINVLICCYFRHHRKLNEIDPIDSVFVPIEQNKQDGVDDPLMIDDYDDSKFSIEALMAHNQYRIQHGAAPLQSNEYLNKAAGDWARELVKMNQLKHSPDQWRRYQGSVLGENLAYFIGPVLKGERLTNMWYRENKNHDFQADLQENSLHFSQLIWKGTREVGFGRCQTPDKKQWYGVALYYPPGNFPNQYAQNVQQRSDLENNRLA